MEGILEKLVTSYQKGNLTNLLRSTNAEHLRDVFQKIEMVILQILQDEGINKEA